VKEFHHTEIVPCLYSTTRFHQDRNIRHAHTHTHTHTQLMIMTYGRILYKNITNVHPRNST